MCAEVSVGKILIIWEGVEGASSNLAGHDRISDHDVCICLVVE